MQGVRQIINGFLATAYQAGDYRVTARCPSTQRILAVGDISAFILARVAQTGDAQIIQSRPDGSAVVRFTMVAENLPDNAEVRLYTNYQDSTFTDGSRSLILHPSDFEHLAAIRGTQTAPINPSLMRTFQRRFKEWRLKEDPEKEVFFTQDVKPGETLAVDWTDMDSLGITIQGKEFTHKLFHAVLPFSGWEWATRAHSESVLSLRTGLKAALGRLGRVPRELLTDHSSIETHRYAENVTNSLSPTFAGTAATLISRSVGNLSGTLQESWSPDPTSSTAGALIKSSTTTTTYQPVAGLSARTVTTTVDDFSQTTDSFLDGKTFKTCGDLSPAMEYRYSVNTTGHFNAQAYLDGTTHREVTATQSDWAGRTIASASLPALNSLLTAHCSLLTAHCSLLTAHCSLLTAHLALTTNEYNSLGQFVKSTDPDDVVTLIDYNTLGEQIITAIDLDRDGTIDFGSDIVSCSERNFLASYAYDGATSLPAMQSISKVWQPGDTNPNAGTVTATSHQAPNGLTVSSQTLGVANPSLQHTTLSGNGNWITTATAPDGTQQRQTYTNGLLVSSSTLQTDHSTQVTSTSFGYDSLNRQTTTTDGRTGTNTTTYLSTTADIVKSVTDAANNTTAFTYDIRGRQTFVDAPDSTDANGTPLTNITETKYFPDGNVSETTGAQTYRVTYTYDYADRKSTMTTYGTQTATTTWLYDAQRGWLTEKNYHGETDNGTTDADYTYTDAGRLKTRTWERGITTTYGYDNGGRLQTTDYSDTTPDVTTTYDSLGRPSSQSNGISATVYDYDPATLQLDKETITHTIPGHPSFTRIIDRKQDNLQRSEGYTLKTPNSTTEQDVTYGYSATNGRFASISGGAFQAPSQTFIYGYETNSNLIKTIHSYSNYDFNTNTGTGIHTVTNTYETNRDVLLTKQNQRASDNATISSVNYNVNKIGQRESVAQTFLSASSTPTTANIQWGYNANGEVTKADHSDTAQNRAHNYDGIGNRLTSSAGVSPASSTTYTPNALNQYTAISGGAFQAPSPVYDDDGNATAYPLPVNQATNATLTYDGENRLINVVTGSTTVVYRYDAQSRRIAKSVGTASNTFFIYDYWNCIGEYTGANQFKSYTWGMDLSGSMQGAGGVGGLLAVHDGSASYYPTYDGNGNISEYLDVNGIAQAHYEYDAFGNAVVSTGAKASDFAHRFSTKPLDAEFGLYYYGYRFYNPTLGGWINRDMIEENGGFNIYNFI